MSWGLITNHLGSVVPSSDVSDHVGLLCVRVSHVSVGVLKPTSRAVALVCLNYSVL